jgi:hypothetical protein
MPFSYKYCTERGNNVQETNYLESILYKLDDECMQSPLAISKIYGGIISF